MALTVSTPQLVEIGYSPFKGWPYMLLPAHHFACLPPLKYEGDTENLWWDTIYVNNARQALWLAHSFTSKNKKGHLLELSSWQYTMSTSVIVSPQTVCLTFRFQSMQAKWWERRSLYDQLDRIIPIRIDLRAQSSDLLQ